MATLEVCLPGDTATYTCLANATNASQRSYFMETCTGEDDTEDWQIGFGVGLGCFGSIGINLGNNLQSLGLNVRTSELGDHIAKLEREGYDLDDPDAELPKLKFFTRGNILFASGSTIFLVASIVNFVAFAFAPASMLAPLEAIQVVAQLFIGRIIFKNPITPLAAGSTAVTFAGVIGVVLSVPPKVYAFSIPQLFALWSDPLWVIYLCLILAAAAAMQITHVIYRRAEVAGKPKWKSHAVTPVTYAGAAAIVGALSVSQAKAISEVVTLLLACFINVFADAFFYITLFMLAASGGIWLNRLTAALGLYDPNFIIPLLQSCYIAFATISGGVFFQEFVTMIQDWWRWPLFALGLCTMLLGLCGLFVAGMRAADAKAASEKAGGPPSGPPAIVLVESNSSEARDTLHALPEASGPYSPNYANDPASQSAESASPTLESARTASSRSRVSFRSEHADGPPQTPSDRPSMMRERSSSRSLVAFEERRPTMNKQMTTGSIAEVIFHSRMSRAAINESLGGAQVGQSSGALFRPSITPRKSVSGGPRDSWSRRGSDRRGSDDLGPPPAVTSSSHGASIESIAETSGVELTLEPPAPGSFNARTITR